MPIYKCKMCGGDLRITEGSTVCECEFCGTLQTVPAVDDEKRATLFNRANRLRMSNEFDKASGIYESIISDFPEEAESYWGLVLCKYGIEYVDDPGTGKKIPTCHRSSFDSVMDDPNFEMVLEYSDPTSRKVYREEAKRIEELRKGIIEISGKEEPYDIFICYKETDENGSRTLDSVLAQDIYDELVQRGYRVFFSRVTLEDKLGQEYEPYIFAALHSAKVMLAVGTDYEYYNAVWVKNEWSRFLQLIAQGEKKVLIPCYKNLDAYDMPKEFARLQAQDMGKVGAMQDLMRGIDKIFGRDRIQYTIRNSAVILNNENKNIEVLLNRGEIALEDKQWEKAGVFFEEVLNSNPRNAEAYLGEFLVLKKCSKFAEYCDRLKNNLKIYTPQKKEACPDVSEHIEEISGRLNIPEYLNKGEIEKLYEFDRRYEASAEGLKEQKEKITAEINSENLLMRAKQYASGKTLQLLNDGINDIARAADVLIAEAEKEDRHKEEIIKGNYYNHVAEADREAEKLNLDASGKRDDDYKKCVNALKKAETISECKNIIDRLNLFNGYKESDRLIYDCQRKIEDLKDKQVKKKMWIRVTIGAFFCAAVAFGIFTVKVIIPNQKHKEAVEKYSDSIKTAYVGDTIQFGHYEQDNNSANGSEEIEWIVLAKDENRFLVISKYALDCQRYNSQYTDITWETCSLREWMNGSFLNAAFDSSEQILIQSSTITADKNPSYSTSPGDDTTDKVFLLSISEVDKYLGSDSERQCQGTAYCCAQGADKTSNDNCWWWLRSPGRKANFAAYVSSSGSVHLDGDGVGSVGGVLRPALWINLE